MRRDDREVTQTDEIEKIIAACKVCRLGITDETAPYVVPLNFGYNAGVLYFHSAPEGKKVDLLKQNPRVCFEMDRIIKMITHEDACEWGVKYESVIGYGQARIIESDDEKVEALDRIMSQYSKKSYSYPEDALKKTLLFKVVIEAMTAKRGS